MCGVPIMNRRSLSIPNACDLFSEKKFWYVTPQSITYLFLLSSPQYLIISRKGETSSNHVENKSLHVSLGTKYVLSNGFCHGRPLCNWSIKNAEGATNITKLMVCKMMLNL